MIVLWNFTEVRFTHLLHVTFITEHFTCTLCGLHPWASQALFWQLHLFGRAKFLKKQWLVVRLQIWSYLHHLFHTHAVNLFLELPFELLLFGFIVLYLVLIILCLPGHAIPEAEDDIIVINLCNISNVFVEVLQMVLDLFAVIFFDSVEIGLSSAKILYQR